jgi:hypothetical protein
MLALIGVCSAFNACRFGYELLDGPPLDPAGGSGFAGSGARHGSGGDPSTPVGGDGSDPTAGADVGAGGSGSGGSVSGSPGLGGEGGTITTGGTSSAGTSGSGGAAGSSGAAGSGAVADLIVSTSSDESDAGATAAAPGGTGLSLREAITIANATGGAQIITFQNGIVVAQSSPPPVITDTVQILNGVVDCTGVGNGATCLELAASSSVIDGLELHSSGGRPIYVTGGANSRISNCSIHDNRHPLETAGTAGLGNVIGPNNVVRNSDGHGIAVYSDSTQVIDNTVLDAGSNAIFLNGTANDTLVRGNVLVRSGTAGIGMGSGTTGLKVQHNTIVYGASSGVVVGQATGVDVRNNIIAFNLQHGLVGADDKFTQQAYNLFFGNGGSDCSPCTVGESSVLLTPEFVNAAGDDYTLAVGSPAVDAGTDLGTDRNGAGAGNFNGAAPDIGAWEHP